MAQKSKNPVTIFQFLFSFFFFSSSFVFLCQAANTITKGQSIIDGDTLESVDGNFELGFFSPENSTSRYLGIRYGKIQEQSVIWIANRDKPILSRNGSFTISQDGNLIVTDGNGISVWSSDASILSNNTTAILEKTGNLVLSSRDSIGDLSKAYWQSFDDPTDTYLPDMKVLASSTGGANVVFTSWKSATDPSPGNFTMGIDPRGSPQIVICDRNSIRVWRSGHWNGLVFTGVPEMVPVTNYQYGFKYTREDDGNWYFTYHPSNPSDLMRFELTWDGFEEQLKWNQSGSRWELMQKQPFDVCDHYNYCGNFGVCTARDSPKCDCMEGFEPKDRDQWSRGNWSGGCVRKSSLQCQRNASVEGETGDDGFKMFNGMKLPDFGDLERKATSPDNCKEICLQNCSCSAFAYVGGIGCMLWQGELIDVQHFEKSGNNLYLRLAESEFGERRISAGVVVAIVAGGVIFLAICIWLLCRLKTRLQVLPSTTAVSNTRKSDTPITDVSEGKEYSTELSGQVDFIEGSHLSSQDLPLFTFSCVEAATDKFSEENKLGQGGFGLVYKGKLPGGEEIAVKRLSRISGQGLEEFKNEITLIAKLQHRNLVRLLGWCVQGEEKILLYEYMPNKSLDFLLFDSEKQPLLDWQKRFAIIEGIARGLLYLHRDSRLRIIHRDLKASNILLDEEMTPKISDFGMARIFGGNQNEANTNRVVGTYGYMAPEYAMEGLFSVKSDVYSFGVLLLEIVSGRRNTSYRSTDHISLIGYAWNLWTERKIAELIDPSIRDSCDESQVSRCIQVGMLCVQDSAFHRPTMATVVLMLESTNTTLPLPRQPSTFTSNRTCIDSDIFTDGHEIASSNELTVTMVTGR